MRFAGLSGGIGTVLAGVLLTTAGTSTATAQWKQWGGPNRDFTIDARNLADSWPAEGPRRIWQRELGVGYSAIVVDRDALYTMYRETITDEDECVVALDTRTGETIWERRFAAPAVEAPDPRWGGQGPNSTPLIVGRSLYAVGSRAVLRCFDKRSGEVQWTQDLAAEHGMPLSATCGYSSSPIAYRSTIILVGGCPATRRTDEDHRVETDERALFAFDRKSGELKWKTPGVSGTFSSPIIVRLEGRNQLLLSTERELIAFDPDDGSVLWRHAAAGGVMTPVWNGRDRVYVSTPGDSGAGRLLELASRDGRIVPVEIKSGRRIAVALPTPVQHGNHLYGTTDRVALCVSMEDGKRVWAKRGFPSASCLHADGKLIYLDENGRLTLATATPEGLTIHSQCQLTERYSLTAPSLSGTTLYVRDRKHIMALDLGDPATAKVTN